MPEIIIKLHKHRDMGTMTINLAEITAKTAEDIKEQVEEMISRQNQVVSGQEEAKKLYDKNGVEGYVYQEEARNFTILGEVEGGWQPTFTVVITAYFIDVGSDDYVYSVRVTED